MTSRQAEWQAKKRKNGQCPQCGEKCGTNPRTGRSYYYCSECRAKKAVKSLSRYYSRVRGKNVK